MAKNLSASVHQKLLTRAKDSDRPFNELLQYFAMERFLNRLSQSRHAGQFVLKGALLFRVWDAEGSRATRDIDFLAYAENSLDSISRIIINVLLQEVPHDGFAFDEDSVNATRIKEDSDYEGVRIVFDGYLGKACVRMQLESCFRTLFFVNTHCAACFFAKGSRSIKLTIMKPTMKPTMAETMVFTSHARNPPILPMPATADSR